MKTHVAIALVALTAVAVAEPKRKHKPDKYEVAAGDAFAAAIEADDKGDLPKAAKQYRKALELATHPNVAYNLAEVDQRSGAHHDAIKAYELYLALAPNAPDRKQVLATIADLEHGPTTFEIESDDLPRAYVLLDGAIVKRPGEKQKPMPSTAGYHMVAMVTPTSAAQLEVELQFGRPHKFTLTPPTRLDGSVVLAVPYHIDVTVHGTVSSPRAIRFAVDKGRYRAAVSDRNFECAPITIDVPGGNDVAFVYAAPVAEERMPPLIGDEPTHCRKLDVKQHKLVFE